MKKCKQCGRTAEMRGSFCSNSCKLISDVYYKRTLKQIQKQLQKRYE